MLQNIHMSTAHTFRGEIAFSRGEITMIFNSCAAKCDFKLIHLNEWIGTGDTDVGVCSSCSWSVHGFSLDCDLTTRKWYTLTCCDSTHVVAVGCLIRWPRDEVHGQIGSYIPASTLSGGSWWSTKYRPGQGWHCSYVGISGSFFYR